MLEQAQPPPPRTVGVDRYHQIGINADDFEENQRNNK